MGILIFTARVHDLIFQKSNIEYRLSKLTKKLRDVQQYAATVGNGSISVSADGEYWKRATIQNGSSYN